MVAEYRPLVRYPRRGLGVLLASVLAVLAAVPALATDYRLVAPASLKSAAKLVVVDPSGKLGAGDRVVAVAFGGEPTDGLACAVWAGDGPAKAIELAAAGGAKGFPGAVVTGDCKAPKSAVKATLVEAVTAAGTASGGGQADNKKLLTWAALAIGGVLVVGALWRLVSRGSGASDPVAVKGIERRLDSLREQIKRLEERRTEAPKVPAWAEQLIARLGHVEERLGQLGAQPDLQPLQDQIDAFGDIVERAAGGFGEAGATAAALRESSERLAQQVAQTPDLAGVNATLAAMGQAIEAIAERHAPPIDLRPEVAALRDAIQAMAKRQAPPIDLRGEIAELRSAIQAVAERQAPPVDVRPEVAALRVDLEALARNLEAVDVRPELAALRAELPPATDLAPALVQLAELRTISERLEGRFEELASSASDPGETAKAIEQLATQVAATASRVDALAESTDANIRSGDERLFALGDRFETELGAVRASLDPLATRFGDDAWMQDLRDDVQSTLSDLHDRVAELASRPVSHEVADAAIDDLQRRIETVTQKAERTEEAIADLSAQMASAPPASTVSGPWGDVIYSAEAIGPLADPEPQAEPQAEPDPPAEPAKVSFDLDETIVAEDERASGHEDEPEPGPERDRLLWSRVGGSSERLGSRTSRRPLALGDLCRVVKPLTPTDTPDCSCPVGALLFAHGHVVFSHGAFLRGFWPCRDRKTLELPTPIPGVAWRLAANHEFLYAALEDRIVAMRLSDWSRQAEFVGAYQNQVCNGSLWAGLTQIHGGAALDVRSVYGKQLSPPVALPFDAMDCVALAASGDTLFAASSSGSICRVKAGADKPAVFEMGPDRELLHLCVRDRSLVTLAKTEGDVLVQAMDFRGKRRREGRLGTAQVGHCPVVMGDSLYVPDRTQGGILELDLRNLDAAPSRIAPDLRTVRSMCGVEHGDQRRLLAIAGDDGPRKGRALVLDAATGDEFVLCSVSSRVHAEIMPADGHVVVATCTTYQNVIQVYDPFVAEEVGEDRAA